MQHAALSRRERQVGEVNVVLWFVCVNQRDLRETLGVLLWQLIEYSYVNILPQIAQITQRNAASCIITQRKTGCLRLRLFWGFVVNVVLGFVCVNLRDLRENRPFTHTKNM